jgi:HEAT repeat protein
MSRTFVSIFAALLSAGLLADVALAHGGVYRGPGGAVPPGQREPTDPMPPAPPPPGDAPTTPPSTPPALPGPTTGPSTPTPPGTPPAYEPPTSGGAGRRPGRTSIGMDSWMFWYEVNKARLQNVKRSIYTLIGSEHPFAVLTGASGSRTGATQATRAEVERELVPALLWAVDPENARHQDTQSAAYIALAKVSTDLAHVERIRAGLDSKHQITRESCALALGLLRRERPSDQLAPGDLDKIRAFLFEVLDDEARNVRTRGFAAFALGLLAGQPTRTADGEIARTTEKLFERLVRKHRHPDLPIALLTAIRMQPRDAVTDEQRAVLRECTRRQRLGSDTVPNYVAQFAASALGRVGDSAKDILFLQRIYNARRSGANLQRSAAIALGELGRHAGAEARCDVARTLIEGIKRRKVSDRSARSFAVISLAYLVMADVKAGRTDVLAAARVDDYLTDLAERGPHGLRAYGALALGLVCRAIGDDTVIDVYGEFQADARRVLRAGLASKTGDPRERAAFAIGLGLATDEASAKDLVALVDDEKLDQQLRGYAAIALGHLGMASQEVLDPIRRALKSRTSVDLRRATATALGMLRDRKAVPLLLQELALARSQSAKGQVVLALAQIGDDRAVRPLVERLRDMHERNLTRALACAGLGVVGDLEWLPSLSHLYEDINYRAAGSLVAEVLSIL